MDSYRKMLPVVMTFLGLIFLVLYVINPLHKNLDNKGQIVLLFALVAVVSFWNKLVYYSLWVLMIVGLVIYYFIL